MCNWLPKPSASDGILDSCGILNTVTAGAGTNKYGTMTTIVEEQAIATTTGSVTTIVEEPATTAMRS